MNYSMINISKDHGNGLVDGVWLQDCSGTTLETATKRARKTEVVNGNQIKVAVVESFLSGGPNYCIRTGLKRLD